MQVVLGGAIHVSCTLGEHNLPHSHMPRLSLLKFMFVYLWLWWVTDQNEVFSLEHFWSVLAKKNHFWSVSVNIQSNLDLSKYTNISFQCTFALVSTSNYLCDLTFLRAYYHHVVGHYDENLVLMNKKTPSKLFYTLK